jgi:hypothetical protein
MAEPTDIDYPRRMREDEQRRRRSTKMTKTAIDNFREKAEPLLAELRALAPKLADGTPNPEVLKLPAEYVEGQRRDLRRQLGLAEGRFIGEANAELAEAISKAQGAIAAGDQKAFEPTRVADLLEARQIADSLPDPKRLTAANRLGLQILDALRVGRVSHARVLLMASRLAGVENAQLARAVEDRLDLLPHRQAAVGEVARANEQNRQFQVAVFEARRDAAQAVADHGSAAAANVRLKMAKAYAPGGPFGTPLPDSE